jgi:beta-lactam-binding protein with PASTA domain
MSAEEATEELKDAGFDSVTVTDTLGDQTKDTNRVIRQAPEADAEIPDTVSPKVATIVVNRPATEIPVVANQPVSVAIERLRQRDLVLGSTSGQYTGNIAQNQTISRTFPTEGTRVAVKSAVNLVIYAYSTTPPPDCPNLRSCVVQLPRDLEVQLEGLRRTRVQ